MFKKILRLFGIIILLFIIIFDIVFFFELRKSEGNITKATIGVLEKVANGITENKPIFVVLLGINDDLNQNLTDTIMCLGYNPVTQKAFIVSIPRDTFVGENINNAKPTDKINTLYNKKNPEKIINKLTQITGINFEYYVVIDNDAVVELVDIIGGVEFDVPIDMNYDDKTQNLHIHLKKGRQLIDGKKAEALLRFRHNNNGSSYPADYGDNDYGRMKTGREFIMALLSQCLKSKKRSEIADIIEFAFENINTNISLSYILSYLIYAYSFNTDDLQLEQIPGKSIYSNGLWLFQIDYDETDQIFQKISKDFYE